MSAFRRSKVLQKEDMKKRFNKKSILKGVGKLTPGGAVASAVKEGRSKPKRDVSKRDTSYLKEKSKKNNLYRLDKAPKGEAKKPIRRLKPEVRTSRKRKP